jgi:hypothetical protein
MTDSKHQRALPAWYWAAAVVALLWSAIGCFAYVSQVSMGTAELAQLPLAQREIWAMMPAWVTGAYAVAVWSSLAGSIALLLRRRVAVPLYAVSVLAIIAQFGWTFLATPILTTIGTSAIGFPLFILIAGLATLWFARACAARGWLR